MRRGVCRPSTAAVCQQQADRIEPNESRSSAGLTGFHARHAVLQVAPPELRLHLRNFFNHWVERRLVGHRLHHVAQGADIGFFEEPFNSFSEVILALQAPGDCLFAMAFTAWTVLLLLSLV